MMSTDTELDPCPFCAETPRLLPNTTMGGGLVSHSFDTERHPPCPCRGLNFTVEAWNTRASGLAGVVGERDAQIETLHQMREIAQELGYPSILEALEASDALKAEVLRLVDALTYAHSEGFRWPSDPLPFGSIAHDLFIYRGNDPERIAALSEGERKQEGSDNG